jgi:hypothetical protein
MLRIEAQGDSVFALLDQEGEIVGCVRGTSVRVGTFATAEEAIGAALRGDVVTDGYVRGGPDRCPAGETAYVSGPLAAHGARTGRDRSQRSARVPVAPHQTALVHDGAYEWIVLGRRPVARLIRPGASAVSAVTAGTAFASRTTRDRRATSRTDDSQAFSLEFVLPDAIPTTLRLTIARELHQALHPSARPASESAPVSFAAPGPARAIDERSAGQDSSPPAA